MTTYELDELCEKYQLSRSEGERIIKLCGPSPADVDVFIAVSRNRQALEAWALNPAAASMKSQPGPT